MRLSVFKKIKCSPFLNSVLLIKPIRRLGKYFRVNSGINLERFIY